MGDPFTQDTDISIAILEDNESMLIGLCAQFEQSSFNICVATDNVLVFTEKVEIHKPQVAIIDLRIWKSFDAGLEAVKMIRTRSPYTHCIIYTNYDDLDNFDRALRLGVKAFVRKQHDVKPKVSLTEIVEIVARGHTHFESEMLSQYANILDHSEADGLISVYLEPKGNLPKLTRRQIEILKLLDKGLSNQEIADKLVITINTVKAHTKNIREKLDVKSTPDAVRKANMMNLLS